MADPIGFYNSDYTGKAIDAAVKQTADNKTDIENIKKNKLDKPSGLDTAYKIVTTNNSSTGTLGYTHESTGSTVMQRDANGRAQVVAGTSGNEIVNFAQLQAAIKSTYRHVIQLSKEDNQHLIDAVLVVYSSNPTKVNSLETLKALLGNTFIYPVNGTVNYAGDGRYATTYMKQDYLYTMKDFISLTGITFTDTFTEI